MLYITTRNHNDAFTANHALKHDLASDGGRYVPFRLPVHTSADLLLMKDKPFNENIANILNLFFSARLTGWDIDFSVGKNSLQTLAMNHRIVVSELWHNLHNDYNYAINQLYGRLLQSDNPSLQATEWVKIAVHIAFLFAIYVQLMQGNLITNGQTIDISLPVGDFSLPIAALYAKKLGLPIGMIVCTAENNSATWDLIHRGSFNTSDADPNLICGFERLLHLTYGSSEALRLCNCYSNARAYSLPEDRSSMLNRDIFCVVTGSDRVAATINSVYRSNGHILDPKAALCYAGLQDYRAKTGVNNLTLLLCQDNPGNYARVISDATGVSLQKLNEILNHPKE